MAYFGYHRVSTKQQNLDRGLIEIRDYCNRNNITLYPNNEIITDKSTGNNLERHGYNRLKELARTGDSIIIIALDRLGRKKDDVINELQYYKNKNIRVLILNIPYTLATPPDSEDKVNRAIFDMIGDITISVFASVAQIETEMRKDRQEAGIDAKRISADWEEYGRPRSMVFEEFEKYYRNVWLGKEKPFECMKKLCLKKSTFYRYKKEFEERHGKCLPMPPDNFSHPSPIQDHSNPKHQQPDLPYETFCIRYADFIEGVFANYNPSLQKRADILNLDLHEFEKLHHQFVKLKFDEMNQQVANENIPIANLMAKLHLTQEEYNSFVHKQEQTNIQCETVSDFNTVQAQVNPETTIQSVTPPPIIKETFEDSNTETYINNLKARIKQAKPVYENDPTSYDSFKQWYKYLPSLVDKPLSEVKAMTNELERAVNQMIAQLDRKSIAAEFL